MSLISLKAIASDVQSDGGVLASFTSLLRFCSSFCIQYNTQEQKSGKKRGRPGNTYHVNDVRWTQGGLGGAVPDYKYAWN